jgi:hypothetical protein
MRVKIPTQIIGVTSTPPNGRTILRVGAKKGSVGIAIKLKGNLPSSTCGYQVKTIRKINRSVIIVKRTLKMILAILARFMSRKVKIFQVNIKEYYQIPAGWYPK